MKNLFITITTIVISQVAFCQSSQNIGFNLTAKDYAVIDSLVEKGFKNSYFLRTLHEEKKIRQTKVWQEKSSWLSSFRFGVQLFSLTNDAQNEISTTGIIPSLGVTLQISPDKIITLPSRVKMAKSDVRRAKNDIFRQRKILRNWIEQKYLDYLQALQVVKLRRERLQSQLELAVLVKEKFKEGEALIDDLIKVQGGIEQMEEGLLRSQVAAEKIYRELTVMIEQEGTDITFNEE